MALIGIVTYMYRGCCFGVFQDMVLRFKVIYFDGGVFEIVFFIRMTYDSVGQGIQIVSIPYQCLQVN
jgi:hypothetical protein